MAFVNYISSAWIDHHYTNQSPTILITLMIMIHQTMPITINQSHSQSQLQQPLRKQDDDTIYRPSPTIYVEIGFVAVTLFFLLCFIMHEIFKSCNSTGTTPIEPEEQIQYMLCMSENAIYEYLLILRVGCPSQDFDRNNSYIDFEILGQKDEVIGSPVRFDCSRLSDIVCGEMHLILRRLTPMPTIQGIRASHSNRLQSSKTSKSASIFFYEFELRDRTESEEQVVDFRLMLDYIEFRPRIFRGFVPKNLNDDTMVGVYPEIPILELSPLEIAIFAAFAIVMSGTFCILLEYGNLYLINQKQKQGSLYRSLQDLLFAGPVVMLVLMGNIFVYKYNIKRLATRYEYSVNQTSNNYMRYFARSYLIFTVKLIIACDALIIYFGLKTSYVLSLYWISSTVLTSSTVLGIWSCLNKIACMSTIYANYSNKLDSWSCPTKVEIQTHQQQQQPQQQQQQVKNDNNNNSSSSSSSTNNNNSSVSSTNRSSVNNEQSVKLISKISSQHQKRQQTISKLKMVAKPPSKSNKSQQQRKRSKK